jgi:hypothetical protein
LRDAGQPTAIDKKPAIVLPPNFPDGSVALAAAPFANRAVASCRWHAKNSLKIRK